MPDDNNKTRASIFLDQHPKVRSKVLESADFLSWKNQFPTVDIDGIKNYLIGGPKHSYERMNPGADQLYEEDDLILLWAQQHNLVSKEDIDKNLPG